MSPSQDHDGRAMIQGCDVLPGALLRLGEGSELRACLLKLALKDHGSDSTDHLTRGCEGSLHKRLHTASASQLSGSHERLHKQSAEIYAIYHSHSPRTSAQLLASILPRHESAIAPKVGRPVAHPAWASQRLCPTRIHYTSTLLFARDKLPLFA